MTPDQLAQAYAAVVLLVECDATDLMPFDDRQDKLQQFMSDWDRVQSQARALAQIRPEFAEKYELGCRHAREAIVASVVEEFGFDWLMRVAAQIEEGQR